MSKVAVSKISPAEPASLQQVTDIFDQIRRRAFELFERRGQATGKDLDDWLNAERETIFAPASEMVERDDRVELRVAAPGFKADELEVRASPDSIIVEGRAESRQEQRDGKIYFSELSERDLLRRFPMPTQIDPDKIAASLQEGIVTIVALKATAALPKPDAPETAVLQKGKTSAA